MDLNEPKVYAVKHKNIEIRMASRSGGIFTAISDKVLNEGGLVYGCVMTEDFEVVHIRADNVEDRNRMRGSKYVQSNIGNIFLEVQEDLLHGKSVLFSGTSCQVAGLKGFLGKEHKNLICVDIVCHGVPSPLVWQKYKEWQEIRNGICISVDFRNKKDYGWASHFESLTMKKRNGRHKNVDSKVYTNIFYGHSTLRPCCYRCPYKSIKHPGDITIADYWGIDKAAPGFNDNKGVSLVLVNNELGLKMFDRAKSEIDYQETKLESSIQRPLVEPFDCPAERKKIWNDLYKYPFEEFARRYGGLGWKQNLKRIMTKIKIKARL